MADWFAKNKRLDISELSELSGVERRTIRYYIQVGLLDKPIGATRSAHYTIDHLLRLREIRKLRDQGWPLEVIRQKYQEMSSPPATPVREPGDVSVQTNVLIDEGIELIIDPEKAQLTSEQTRKLYRQVQKAHDSIRNNKGNQN